jgi:predicted aldo/keto reductase-like oxidoreductase
MNRVGRTDVRISAVGFGTCQLRLVPDQAAHAALMRGFELGVNWVHVSPDYAGTEDIVAHAIRASGRDVIPVSDGSGDMRHFEHVFENTCRIFGRAHLPLWGISCIDDQEFVGNDVWGPRGMVEFVRRKKREGRIGAAYCTTHAPPEYVARLITSGAFDAIMLAYNPLGFHVLSSYAAAEGKLYEDIPANRASVFGLARDHGVGILAMKALAGGLLGKSKALPPHHVLAREREELTARDVLRYILRQDGITAVVPGAANVAEAEEDALAGHEPLEDDAAHVSRLESRLLSRIGSMRATICSRCGACEPTCSEGLPISWMFRDAYIWMNPSDTFDAVERLAYFHLHPESELVCARCSARTCACPATIDIPRELERVHAGMQDLRSRGLLPKTPSELERAVVGSELAARVVYAEVPREIAHGFESTCRFWIENASDRLWIADERDPRRIALDVYVGDRRIDRIALREDVHPRSRTHIVFTLRDIDAARESTLLSFVLSDAHGALRTEVARASIALQPETSA